MVHSTRLRLAAAALFAAAFLPLVLRMGAAGEEAAPTSIPKSHTAGQHTKAPRPPCPCRGGGGDAKDDDESPFEVIKFLHPRLTDETLRKGADLALVYAEVPGFAPDDYLLRVYEFEDKVVSTFVDRRGAEIPLDTRGFSIGEPGYVEACVGGGNCDVYPNPDGTIGKTCCYWVACSNGFSWLGCFSSTLP